MTGSRSRVGSCNSLGVCFAYNNVNSFKPGRPAGSGCPGARGEKKRKKKKRHVFHGEPELQRVGPPGSKVQEASLIDNLIYGPGVAATSGSGFGGGRPGPLLY